jgi:hypothetical protein
MVIDIDPLVDFACKLLLGSLLDAALFPKDYR